MQSWTELDSRKLVFIVLVYIGNLILIVSKLDDILFIRIIYICFMEVTKIFITIYNDCSEQEFINSVRINGLLEHNMKKTNGKLKVPNMEFTNIARNEKGVIVGGVSGSTYLSSLEIEVLWVQEAYRGQKIASRLLEVIENQAKDAGCQIVHLTTYSFQAPLFYQKQGYVICGEVNGFPDDIRLYTLKKQL
ncbi:GNAT family N-acetyltransferase [Clostridium sp. WB02_MRS01]|uniref:GNAT family N-acetyltransferase n=1 Tax=Clostridium sp. WB02_MRS01 TaxID=2605777 RepID=UPI00257034C4|nr:GNAT family N-acetyltransferase [Clostridium sp. WB02_MRS01]